MRLINNHREAVISPQAISAELIAKDRVLGHNPVAALQLADSYYSHLWGPDRPAKAPKLLAVGRKRPQQDAMDIRSDKV